jgi:hypothetical protein
LQNYRILDWHSIPIQEGEAIFEGLGVAMEEVPGNQLTDREESQDQGSFSQHNLDRIFRISAANPDRLISRENSTLEFKEGFGWKSLPEYARTLAAFSNAQGGYIVFGVKDRPRILEGLTNDRFEELDPAKLTRGLQDYFEPEIQWESFICMFQAKSTADSDASRPLVPVDVDQRFRCKASTN